VTRLINNLIPFAKPILDENEKDMVSKVLSGHILTHGPNNEKFELNFAKLIGVKYAISTSSCTAAMQLCLMAKDIAGGDEVIVPAMTHVATAHAVELLGAKPVFVDVDKNTGNIDPDKIRENINKNTRAIIPVHYLGLTCDMDRINSIADEYGIFVIEDCALAIGGSFKKKAAGSFGLAGCFSFYPSKHITTLEGGMIVTDDKNLKEKVKKLRSFGYSKDLRERKEPGVYDIEVLGHNFRMSEVNAAIGLCQLKKLPTFMKKRYENAKALVETLKSCKHVTYFPLSEEQSNSGYYCVNFNIKKGLGLKRSEVITKLSNVNIGSSVHYPVALPYSKYYKNRYRPSKGLFPVSQKIAENTVSIPCGPHVSKDEINYISSKLFEFLN